jgi:hypothetical protein
MMQVIDAFDGSVVAEAPPLPAAVKDVVWEFPRMVGWVCEGGRGGRGKMHIGMRAHH